MEVATTTCPLYFTECPARFRELTEGWNLISIVDTSNISEAILESANVKNTYKYDGDKYVSLNNTDTLQKGDGYWVFLSDEALLDLDLDESTAEPQSIEISLTLGWNLISHPFEKNVKRSNFDSIDGVLVKYTEEGKYDIVSTDEELLSGEAYWFLNTTESQLVLKINNPSSSETSNVIELSNSSDVSVSNQKYIFNGNTLYDSSTSYSLKDGTYTLKNVPASHPIAILNSSTNTSITYSGDASKKSSETISGTTADGTYDFYHGDVTVNVLGNFGTVSVYCQYHGYMGGKNLFKYDSTGSNNVVLEINDKPERGIHKLISKEDFKLMIEKNIKSLERKHRELFERKHRELFERKHRELFERKDRELFEREDLRLLKRIRDEKPH